MRQYLSNRWFSRLPRIQLVIFVLLFGLIGAVLLWRSFASSGIVLTAANLDQINSMGASLIKDPLSTSKSPASVVQLPNDSINHRYAVFTSSTTELDPGTYTVCLVGRTPNGSSGGGLTAVATGTGLGSNSPGTNWSLSKNNKYWFANGCIKNLILNDPQHNITVTVINSVSSGSTLDIYGITINRAGNAPKQANRPTTVKNGNWSDPSVWNVGHVPGTGDKVIIANNIKYNLNSSRVAGVYVNAGASLTFDPTKSDTLLSSANVIVEGALRMQPKSASLSHTLRFVNVDESKFVGGGMEPIDTDVGLWIMGDGQLDAVGAAKTGWTRASGSIAKGVASVTLNPAPSGWRSGDNITIAPTQAPSVGNASWMGFDEASLKSISSNTINFNQVTSYPHPMVNNSWTAEVANLTRNVMIEGTATGRAHIFIRSDKPQTVNYVAIRYMGPRQTVPGQTYDQAVLGRYGLHFHMSGDGTRGTTVTGTVVRDTGSHAFVPHSSDGITFTDTVSYNTFDEAYWWDQAPDTRTPGAATDNTVFDHAMAALVKVNPSYRGARLNGFTLGNGIGNVIKNSVAVGVQGNVDASGFNWPEGAGSGRKGDGIWTFNQGNVAHNNKEDGIFTWQNVSAPHTVSNFVAYYNGAYGISHGAYGNSYTYSDGIVYGNGLGGIRIYAVSCACGVNNVLHFDRLLIDGGGISNTGIFTGEHNSTGTISKNPTYIENPVFRNVSNAFVFADSPNPPHLNMPDAFIVINPVWNGANQFVFAPSHKNDTVWVETGSGSTKAAYSATPLAPSSSSKGISVKSWGGFKTPIPPFQ